MRISFVEISTEKRGRREVSTPRTAAQIRREASDAQILAAMFPGMSKSTRDANAAPALAIAPPAAPVAPRCADVPRLVLRLTSQVRGGKNGMGVTRTGRHYAKPTFARWRDDAVRQIRCQLPSGWKPIDVPCNVRLDYVAGDKRRRDMPAVLDAVWHVLEKAGVVADDTLLWAVQSSRSYDKAAPGVTITFL